MVLRFNIPEKPIYMPCRFIVYLRVFLVLLICLQALYIAKQIYISEISL